MKEVKKIEYVNKRGEVVHVLPWTLNKGTTLYTMDAAARYIRGSHYPARVSKPQK